MARFSKEFSIQDSIQEIRRYRSYRLSFPTENRTLRVVKQIINPATYCDFEQSVFHENRIDSEAFVFTQKSIANTLNDAVNNNFAYWQQTSREWSIEKTVSK